MAACRALLTVFGWTKDGSMAVSFLNHSAIECAVLLTLCCELAAVMPWLDAIRPSTEDAISYTGIHRYTPGIHRYTPGIHRHTQVYTWYTQAYTGIHNYSVHKYTQIYTGVQVYTGKHRYTHGIQGHTHIHSYTQVYTWYTQAYTIPVN